MEELYVETVNTLISISKKLGKYEYGLISTVDKKINNNISPSINFISFLEKNNIILPDGIYKLMHPALLFAILSTDYGIIVISDDFSPSTLKHEKYGVNKVHCDNFGNYIYDDNNDILLINPININYMNTLDKGLVRHPYLKKILSKYCQQHNLEFDEKKLKEKLNILNLKSDIYDFYDADEKIIIVNPEGTYFDIIPMDIKIIILDLIYDDIMTIKTDDNLIDKIMNNLIDRHIGSGTLNIDAISDIYTEFNNDGVLDKLKGDFKNNNLDLAQFMNKMGGANNIINSLFMSAVQNISNI
jgi:hypothetical protein